MTKLFIALFTLAMLAAGVIGQDLDKIASEHIPSGSKLMHRALAVSIGGSDKSILVLYGEDGPAVSYSALVLTTDGQGYKETRLPQPDFTWSNEEPKAVMFENVDADADKEILIIGENYTGIGPTGAQPFYRTRVYDRVGTRFLHLEQVSEKIGNLRTAAAVRKALTGIIKQNDGFQLIDIDELNTRLDAAKEMRTPLQLVSILIEPFDQMASRTVSIESKFADVNDDLAVVVTDDGYADDSVRGVKYKFSLKKNDAGTWRVIAASKGWRCQPNRGHQDFSARPCL